MVFQMSSEIPFVSVIFRAHMTLEMRMVNTAPLGRDQDMIDDE